MVKTRLILPDTNIFIHALSGKESIAKMLKQWIEKQRLVLSVIVMAEFLAKSTIDEEKAFLLLVKYFNTLTVTKDVAIRAVQFRKGPLKRKSKFHLADCLIAAQCSLYNVTLATLNPKDYPQKEINIISKF